MSHMLGSRRVSRGDSRRAGSVKRVRRAGKMPSRIEVTKGPLPSGATDHAAGWDETVAAVNAPRSLPSRLNVDLGPQPVGGKVVLPS